MIKHFTLSLFFLSSMSLKAQQKTNVFLKVGLGSGYSFFERASAPPTLSSVAPFETKDKIGIYYNYEIQLQRPKKLIYEFGFTHFEYKKFYEGSFVNGASTLTISGNQYNKLRYAHFAVHKPVEFKNNNFIFLGLGVSFLFKKSQYTESFNGIRNHIIYEPSFTGLGGHGVVRYEKKLNDVLRAGLEAKYIYLISPGSPSDLSLGAYLRVKL